MCDSSRVSSETYNDIGRVLTIRGLPEAIAQLWRVVETRWNPFQGGYASDLGNQELDHNSASVSFG